MVRSPDPWITYVQTNVGAVNQSDFNLAGSQSEFIINNTKAGPGALAVTIEGPSRVKMDCQEVPEGYKVQYTPMAPGNYLISIKYGGPNHIGGSPFKAKVTGEEQWRS